jgi:Rieske [2Fe-2S] domain
MAFHEAVGQVHDGDMAPLHLQPASCFELKQSTTDHCRVAAGPESFQQGTRVVKSAENVDALLPVAKISLSNGVRALAQEQGKILRRLAGALQPASHAICRNSADGDCNRLTSWVRIIAAENIPPREGRAVRVGGLQLAIFNTGDGFLAIENRCPHGGGPLADGIVGGTTVTCPLHTTGAYVLAAKRRPSPTARVEPGSVIV